jgi:hypothetical protein
MKILRRFVTKMSGGFGTKWRRNRKRDPSV